MLTVLGALVAIWYLAVAPMNIRIALDRAERGWAKIVPEGSVERRSVSVWSLMAANSTHVKAGYELDRRRLSQRIHLRWRPFPARCGCRPKKRTGHLCPLGDRNRLWWNRGWFHHDLDCVIEEHIERSSLVVIASKARSTSSDIATLV
jgi:NitT/TauT family transport system permease protein